MKNKSLLGIAFAFILIVSMLTFASADITLRGYNKVTDTNATKMTVFISIDDTSETGVANQKETNITISANHQIVYLPVVLNRSLVACSYQGIHTKNTYDADGNLISSVVDITYDDINATSSGTSDYFASLKNRDTYEANYLCYWNDAIDDNIFADYLNDSSFSYLANSLDVGFPSWTCKACARQDYEEVVTEYLQAQQTQSDYLKVYVFATNLTSKITEFWLIVYWTVKVFVILILIGLAFAIILWGYHFIKKLAEQM